MRTFKDASGREWVAGAHEEATPRHFGRWYMILRPADGVGPELAVPEIRWQTERSAARTLQTMAEFELRRRLESALRRAGSAQPGIGTGRT